MKLAVATAVAVLACGLGLALAQSADGAQARSGAISAPSPPQPGDVRCSDQCAGMRAAARGSTVRLEGRRLGEVRRVGFKSNKGRVWQQPREARGRAVVVRVPRGVQRTRARVVVRDRYGQRARSNQRLRIVAPNQIPSSAQFRLQSAEVSRRSLFFDANRNQRVEALFTASEPVDVRVQFVRANNGNVVRSRVVRNATPNQPLRVGWNGITEDGKIAPNGRYQVRVGPVSSEGEAENGTGFFFRNHRFPLHRASGSLQWGDGMGAGRGHQGQDIFARCGEPISAARGGRVRVNKFHGRAGFYVVIRGRRTNRDYVYAHLQRRSPHKVGQRVRTGQVIGRNGETGNASGCHLHFELWRGQAYTGRVLDPTAQLRRWARWERG